MNSSTFNLALDLDKMLTRTVRRHGGKELPDFQGALERGLRNGLEETAVMMKQKIIEELNFYGLGDSDIAKNIITTVTDNGVSLVIENEYYIYVEYGTGVVGEATPHPKAREHGVEYDRFGHGPDGWWYPTSEDDPNPTKRFSAKHGIWFAWTAGQQSRPFMLKAWQWGQRSINNIVNKHINREFAKLEAMFK